MFFRHGMKEAPTRLDRALRYARNETEDTKGNPDMLGRSYDRA